MEDFENKIDSIAGNVDRDPESWISKLYQTMNGGSENKEDPVLVESQNEKPSSIEPQNESPSSIEPLNDYLLRFGSDYPMGSEKGLESQVLEGSEQSNSTGYTKYMLKKL